MSITKSKQFTDVAQDVLTLSMFRDQLHLSAAQEDKDTVYHRFTDEQSLAIRDHLIKLFPLPVESSMQCVGELSSFPASQGVTINIANLTLNA